MLRTHNIPKILKSYSIIYKLGRVLANNLINGILFLNLKFTQMVDYVIVPSYYLKNFYIKYGLRENNTKVIYNFQNSPKNSKTDIKNLKKLFGIKDERIITFVGNMIKVKGPEVLLDSFKLLKKKKNLKLIFAGEGYLLEKLKEKASRLKLDKYVIFTGWLSDRNLKALYSLSDVVVIPSLTPETFSLTFLEASGAGKIIIASDIGALSENISNNSNGFLVKPGHPKELAIKIQNVLANFKNLSNVKKLALTIAKSKYNWKQLIEYEKLLKS